LLLLLIALAADIGTCGSLLTVQHSHGLCLWYVWIMYVIRTQKKKPFQIPD